MCGNSSYCIFNFYLYMWSGKESIRLQTCSAAGCLLPLHNRTLSNDRLLGWLVCGDFALGKWGGTSREKFDLLSSLWVYKVSFYLAYPIGPSLIYAFTSLLEIFFRREMQKDQVQRTAGCRSLEEISCDWELESHLEQACQTCGPLQTHLWPAQKTTQMCFLWPSVWHAWFRV